MPFKVQQVIGAQPGTKQGEQLVVRTTTGKHTFAYMHGSIKYMLLSDCWPKQVRDAVDGMLRSLAVRGVVASRSDFVAYAIGEPALVIGERITVLARRQDHNMSMRIVLRGTLLELVADESE